MLNAMAGSFTAVKLNQSDPQLSSPLVHSGQGGFFILLCCQIPSARGFVKGKTGWNFDFHPVQKTDIVNIFGGLWISGHLGDNAE